MEKSNLKNYLKRALELEKNKLELEQTLSRISRKYVPKIAKLNEQEVRLKHKDSSGCLFISIGAAIGFFLAAFLGGPNILILALFTFLGGALGSIISSHIEEEKISNKLALERSAVEKENNKIIASANKKNKMITLSKNQIKSALANTKSELDRLYATNYIHPKYRNLIAVATIYEYIDTGRCNSLEGADGAYNLFELEVRLDRIITKLDVIIRNLEQIRSNQYYLYEAINNIQPQIEKVSNAIIENTNKLNEVAVNTAVTAYTAQVIERNQYYGRNWNDNSGIYSDRVNMPSLK